MTLRTRLALAFFGLLVGPALLATVLFARALPMPAPSTEDAAAALRLTLAARCHDLEVAAEGLAVRAGVSGDTDAVTPANSVGPWALCAPTIDASLERPADRARTVAAPGTRVVGLAARAEIHDADRMVTGYAYAVQPLDESYLRVLSAAAGLPVRPVPIGQAALADMLVPLVVEPAPSAIDRGDPAVIAVVLVGVLGSALLAWWLAGLATRPLIRLIDAVERVAAGDLTARPDLTFGGRDETSRLGSRIDALVDQMVQTQRLSVTDSLTGLGNARSLADVLRLEVERAGRFGRALGVLMLDLDHFKAVNDQYGHRAGDAVLAEFSIRVRRVIREVDLAFRPGGEEFVILLPETDVAGSITVARRVGQAVRAEAFTVDGRQRETASIPVTVSIGVAVFPRHAANSGAVLDAADEALYRAKAAGRDTYALAPAVVPGQRGRGARSAGDAPNETTSPRTSTAG